MFNYLSLFSGIGGFERAIGDMGHCVGFSEIDKNAIAEYQRHYPDHVNLGNIKDITKKTIKELGKIDLLVAGFPCNNLSSANRYSREGLNGVHSGLFWNMLEIIRWINNKDLKIIIENNASMSNRWREEITEQLKRVLKRNVKYIYIDSSVTVPQSRKRYYWIVDDKNVNMPVFRLKKRLAEILEPLSIAKDYIVKDSVLKYKNVCPKTYKGSSGFFVKRVPGQNNCCVLKPVSKPSRWKSKDNYSTNDTVRCITTKQEDNILFDYRFCKQNNDLFVPRFFSKRELSRLFGYPDDYIETNKKTVYQRLFGMTVVVPVVKSIVESLYPI
jgi:DNA-cytosine methyltransferase